MPDFAPDPLTKSEFEAVAKVTVSVAFEAVLFRGEGTAREIYLTQRQADDAYAGQWHCPGSIFRPGEQAENVVARLAAREFKTPTTTDGKCLGDYFFAEERGWFLARVYLVQAENPAAEHGQWWPIDNLPDKLVWHHRERVIPIALAHLLKSS